MHTSFKWTLLLAIFLISGSWASSEESVATTSSQKTVQGVYPGFASGALQYAELQDIPDGQILESDNLAISVVDLESDLKDMPREMRTEAGQNMFLILEQKATEQILARLAGVDFSGNAKKDPEKVGQAITQHLREAIGDVSVTDKDIANFYEENKDMFGTVAFDDVKEALRQHVTQQAQQAAITEYVRTLGQRVPVSVSSTWVKEQVLIAQRNPVDKARDSGVPTLVDFGADGCRPCDMMQPILENVKKRYAGKLNVEFIHVREHPMLAARYGVQSIPVQIIFDKTGKEIWRHTGFVPEMMLEKRLAEAGVE